MKKGIAIFVDSGNEFLTQPNGYKVPSGCHHVWPVGNLAKSQEDDNQLSWVPNRSSGQGDWVPFSTPGTKVPVCQYNEYFYPKKETVEMTGSSFSAPAVAALAARMLSLYPWMNRLDLEITMEYVISPTEFTDLKGNSYSTRCLVLE